MEDNDKLVVLFFNYSRGSDIVATVVKKMEEKKREKKY